MEFWPKLLIKSSGREGALKEVNKFSGSCHKHFRTMEQAEAFIEDWKVACTEVWSRELKKALDQGLRPVDIKLDLEGILQGSSGSSADPAVEDLSRSLERTLYLGRE